MIFSQTEETTMSQLEEDAPVNYKSKLMVPMNDGEAVNSNVEN